MERLARDLLAPGQDGLGGSERDSGGGALKSAHHTRHHLADLLLKLIVDRIPLRFADLLDDHLLGGLGADAAGKLLSVDRHAVTQPGEIAIDPIDIDRDDGGFAVLA